MEDTVIQEAEVMEPRANAVVKFNVTNAEIERLKAEYMPLKINGLEDRAGYKAVYEARQDVKRTRVALQKHAKALKEDAIAWQRKVNTEEKRVVGELEAIEAHLQAEEDKIEAEKERIRKEAEEAENRRMQERMDQLAAYGFKVEYALLKGLDDESFSKVLKNAQEQFKIEQDRKEEEERLAKLEQERIEKERAELEELRKQAAEQKKIIDEQNRKIREEEEKRIREEELQRERERAAEQARLDLLAKQEREAREKAEAEEKARKAAEKKAANAPDKAKLTMVMSYHANCLYPELKGAEAKKILDVFRVKILSAMNEFAEQIDSL